MAKEYFWGATLSKDKKVFKWDPEAEFLDDDDDDDDAISHFLFLKQAVLGVEVEDKERNVVEVETVSFDGENVKQPLFSLRLGLNESTTLDMGLQPPVTFKLVKGSGPVFLSGQHALDLQEDEDFGEEFKDSEAFEMGDEDLDEEEGEEEEEEKKVKRVSTKGKDKNKAAIQDMKVPKKGKGDELDDEEDEDEDEDEDDEEEEEEEEKQTGKGKKRPAPSAKGPAKKMSKPAFDDEDGDEDEDDDDDDDDDEDGIALKMALGDEDDEDDDEEDDEDDEGMDDEDEEDEDEEEESSPEKPAKKAKGKVNGTIKPKGAPKSQQNKPKEKKEKKTFTMDDMKQDLIKSPSKPKKEEKFKNFVKSRFHLSEAKKIQELWGWYKSTQLK